MIYFFLHVLSCVKLALTMYGSARIHLRSSYHNRFAYSVKKKSRQQTNPPRSKTSDSDRRRSTKTASSWGRSCLAWGKRGLLTWPSKDDRKWPCNMTKNAEDCKRYFFISKLYLTPTTQAHQHYMILLLYYQRSIYVYSTVYYEKKANTYMFTVQWYVCSLFSVIWSKYTTHNFEYILFGSFLTKYHVMK